MTTTQTTTNDCIKGEAGEGLFYDPPYFILYFTYFLPWGAVGVPPSRAVPMNVPPVPFCAPV